MTLCARQSCSELLRSDNTFCRKCWFPKHPQKQDHQSEEAGEQCLTNSCGRSGTHGYEHCLVCTLEGANIAAFRDGYFAVQASNFIRGFESSEVICGLSSLKDSSLTMHDVLNHREQSRSTANTLRIGNDQSADTIMLGLTALGIRSCADEEGFHFHYKRLWRSLHCLLDREPTSIRLTIVGLDGFSTNLRGWTQMYNEFKDLDVDIELNFFTHLGFRDATTRKRMNEVTSPNAITENRIATVKLSDFNTAIRLLRMSCKNEELDGHPWQMVSDEDVLDAIADRDQLMATTMYAKLSTLRSSCTGLIAGNRTAWATLMTTTTSMTRLKANG